ncbi:MAG TPA: ABC transporter ATP-binding protein [Spirochaetota bacterium]|nr:ABC transporter ATP-binding protein [Spirochaetota bacterium]
MIDAKSIEKVYGSGRNALRVLRGVSLSIGRGDIISIVGPSGAGKSTLLNVMGCLDGFQSGSLSILGRELSGLSVEDLSNFRNRHIGFVFQLHNLLPDFTALENVMMPLFIRRDGRARARETALSVIERFGMLDRIGHRPGELSGGECQRIAVARAIVCRPDIILADEPTGNLDSKNSQVLMSTLFELGRENGTTIVVVTHDAGIASMTGRTITIVDGAIISAQ